MPFTQDQLDRVQAEIGRALASGSLNDWEVQFLSDMQARLRRDGRQTMLSDKQYRKLMQLSDVRREHSSPYKGSRRRRDVASAVAPHKRRTHSRSVSSKRRGGWRRLRRQAKLLTLAVALAVGVAAVISEGFNTVGTLPPTDYGFRTLSRAQISVVDGDTIRVASTRQTVRLVGFNSPEIFEPRFDAGLALGKQATLRLEQMVHSASSVELTTVPCACPPETLGTRDCNFGRACGVLHVDDGMSEMCWCQKDWRHVSYVPQHAVQKRRVRGVHEHWVCGPSSRAHCKGLDQVRDAPFRASSR